MSDEGIHPELSALRERLDALDDRLVELLNVRQEICREIGRVKKTAHLGVRDSVREEALLNRLARANRGPLSEGALRRVYQALFQASLEEQSRICGE